MRRKAKYIDGLPDPLAVDYLDEVQERCGDNNSILTVRRESRGRLVIEAKPFVNPYLRRKMRRQESEKSKHAQTSPCDSVGSGIAG